ncbi:hypothetical protein D9M69_635220 [compost metagenome]
MARRIAALRRQAFLQALPEREQVLRRGHRLAFEKRDVAALGVELRECAAAQHGRQGFAELRVVFEHQKHLGGVRQGHGLGMREKAGTLARREDIAVARSSGDHVRIERRIAFHGRQTEPAQLRFHRGAAIGASSEVDVAALHGHLRCSIAEGAMQ